MYHIPFVKNVGGRVKIKVEVTATQKSEDGKYEPTIHNFEAVVEGDDSKFLDITTKLIEIIHPPKPQTLKDPAVVEKPLQAEPAQPAA